MPSLNCSSSLEEQVLLLQYLPFQSASTIYSWYGTFQQKVLMFFVLAACETSYARGLKQMQLAPHHSLYNQTVIVSGPLLDYGPIIIIEAFVRT